MEASKNQHPSPANAHFASNIFITFKLNCSIAKLLSLQKSYEEFAFSIAGVTSTDMSGLLQMLLVRIPIFDGTCCAVVTFVSR